MDHRRLLPSLALAACLMGLAGDPGARAEVRQTARPFVWIEGEDAQAHSFNGHAWYSAQGLQLDLLSPGSPGASPGRWLAHYSNDGRGAEATYGFRLGQGGAHTFWLRASSYQTRMSYRLDGGPWAAIDTDSDPRETIRLNQPDQIDIRFVSWLKVGLLDLAAGDHLLQLRVEARRSGGQEAHGGIDALVLIDPALRWAPTGALRPDLDPAEPAPDAWFPLIPTDDPYSPTSATDLSAGLLRPAGAAGPVRRDGDSLRFADGGPARFWGVNALPGANAAVMAQQARFLAKHGVNLVRVHPIQPLVGLLEAGPGGEQSLNAARLERLDRWFATLKEAGIYSQWSAFYPHVIRPEDGYPAELYAELPDAPLWNYPPGTTGKSTSGFVNLMRPLQDAEWAWLRVLMEHTNPYTGLRYADDPALAVVEVHNEDSIFWHAPLNAIGVGTQDGRPIPRHQGLVQGMWRDWLRARYASDTALLAAWGPSGRGSRPGDGLDNGRMGIYEAWEMAGDGPERNKAEKARMGDFIRFLAESQRAYFERRQSELRAVGYRGLTVSTAWMAGGPAARMANLWTDEALDMVDRHRYTGGMADGAFRIAPNRPIRADSGLGSPGAGILGAGLEQVEDKPFMLSEWTHSPPNEWKAEAAPIMAFYGLGLQGWDASTHFSAGPPRMGGGWPRDNDLFVTETPAYIGQFPALARSVHEGHIRAGEPVAARRLALDDLFRGVDPIDQPTASGGWEGSGPGSLSTPAETLAIGRVSFRATGLPERSMRADWSRHWQSAASTVRSATGELTWDYGRRTITVGADRTQAVIGFAGGRTFTLPALEVTVDTAFVSLLFTSLDGQPLQGARRWLITALARDRQTGSRYNAARDRLESVGGPPLLLEPVQATLKLPSGVGARLHVLDIHGDRTGREVPAGESGFRIDGRYASYLYELERTDLPAPSATPVSVASPTATPSATATLEPASRVYLPWLSGGR